MSGIQMLRQAESVSHMGAPSSSSSNAPGGGLPHQKRTEAKLVLQLATWMANTGQGAKSDITGYALCPSQTSSFHALPRHAVLLHCKRKPTGFKADSTCFLIAQVCFLMCRDIGYVARLVIFPKELRALAKIMMGCVFQITCSAHESSVAHCGSAADLTLEPHSLLLLSASQSASRRRLPCN